MSNQPPVKAQYATPPGKTSPNSGKAIASFILGLSSFFCFVITGLIAIIMGVLALSDIAKSRGRLQGNAFAIAGIVTGVIGCLWTFIGIAMLLPAVQQIREAARQVSTVTNARELNLALINFETANGRFPPAKVDDGLSWRVHILPFLGENSLYDQFHLDEPWDSPHNLSLVNRMPDVFKSLNHNLEPGKTLFAIPTSPASTRPNAPRAFVVEGQPGPRVKDIQDGISYSILLLEVNPEAAVTWTDPDGDWTFDPDDPMRDIGNARPRVIITGFADGRTQAINNQISPKDFSGLVTINGGEAVNVNPF